ncbi:MAG: sigma-54 dependent transcriptional regulator [Bacteroidota bacterium]
MPQFKIFVVEDDPWYGEILRYHLSLNPDYDVYIYTTGNECLQNLSAGPNIISVDYLLPDMNGSELLKKIKQVNSNIPVIVISAQKDVNTAVKLIREGAADYFIKDDNTKDLLWNAVKREREHLSLVDEVEHLKEKLGQKFDFQAAIKGNSPAMSKVFALLEKASKININVSVSGETGTGKEVVAKAIHYNSERRKKPFVAVNMAAIPRELIESELFGYEKGAFTGAVGRKKGKFEEADTGTLFLDEIAELDLSLQSKILRVLQEREITRVGGNERLPIDIRLVVATHKNLLEEVKKGNFREDLFYRIMGMPIELPPLRERGSDILILGRYFLEEFCRANKLGKITIAPEAIDKLVTYKYPGNVRELKSVMELAAVMCDGSVITETDIHFTSLSKEEAFAYDEKTLKEYTNDIIAHFLRKYNNNVIQVADKLDIGKSTIYKMLQEKKTHTP